MVNFQRHSKRRKQYNQGKRVAVLFSFALFIALIYISRLLYLQVFAGEPYRKAAISQRRRSVDIAPRRGAIYDRNKNPLALSVTVNTCYLFPEEVENQDEEADLYSYILGLERSTVLEAIRSDRHAVKLKTQISQEEMDQLNDSGLRSYSLEQESARYYPNQELLSNTLGFLDGEGAGSYGLEAYYDEELRGSKGRNVYSRDLHGNVIPVEESSEISASAGNNLYLTIDLDLQRIVAEQMQAGFLKHKPESLMAILMDPNTGEVLAMENIPSFNANHPREPLSDKDRAAWNNMTEDRRLEILYESWKNPNISTSLEPGSVFKVLTTAISLETKSSKPSSSYLCTGSIEIAPGERIYCTQSYDPHGEQTLEEALINSCNPAFVQIVREIGPERYYSYMQSLRLNDVSGIDMPAEFKSAMPKSLEDLTQVQMATMSYGHGVSASPIQIITALNTTINGGYYVRPHLLSRFSNAEDQPIKEYQAEEPVQVFSEETSNTLRQYLVNTVQESGSPVRQIEEISVGGKSGTTEKIVDGSYSSDQTYASYWSFFPADDPRYSLLVVADYPKTSIFGSTVSGDITTNIISKILEYERGTPVNLNQEGLLETPNLMGLTVKKANELLSGMNLKLSVYGDMSEYQLIDRQEPGPGELINPYSTVRVEPDDPPLIEVPDFTGMTEREVEIFARDTHLQIELEGKGKVIYQKPQSGEKVEAETSIVLTMSEE